jgi:hypothetical protein
LIVYHEKNPKHSNPNFRDMDKTIIILLPEIKKKYVRGAHYCVSSETRKKREGEMHDRLSRVSVVLAVITIRIQNLGTRAFSQHVLLYHYRDDVSLLFPCAEGPGDGWLVHG